MNIGWALITMIAAAWTTTLIVSLFVGAIVAFHYLTKEEKAQ